MITCSLLVGRTTSSCSVGKMPEFVFLLNFTEALGQTGVPCSLGSKHANVLRAAVRGLRLDKMRWLTSCAFEEALALITLLLWCSANRRNSQDSQDVRTKKGVLRTAGGLRVEKKFKVELFSISRTYLLDLCVDLASCRTIVNRVLCSEVKLEP